MTNPIPPGFDRSPMGQWAKAVADCTLKCLNGYESLNCRITSTDRVCAHGVIRCTPGGRFHRLAGGYQAFIPIGDTATEARLRWEAQMMAKHGETVQGLEGNPWIGWAECTEKSLPYIVGVGCLFRHWDGRMSRYAITNLITQIGRQIAFLRPGDTAREAELRAQLSPDLDPTREGSGRALNADAAPAPERVEPALQVGTPETWEEHVARRFRLTWCRSILDEHYQTVAGHRDKNDPPQHPLTTPPDKTPTLDIFWGRG